MRHCLTGAQFHNTNLAGATLKGADITGIVFQNVNLTGTMYKQLNIPRIIFWWKKSWKSLFGKHADLRGI